MDIWSKRCVPRKVINEMFFMAYFLVDVMDKATSTQLCLLNVPALCHKIQHLCRYSGRNAHIYVFDV